MRQKLYTVFVLPLKRMWLDVQALLEILTRYPPR